MSSPPGSRVDAARQGRLGKEARRLVVGRRGAGAHVEHQPAIREAAGLLDPLGLAVEGPPVDVGHPLGEEVEQPLGLDAGAQTDLRAGGAGASSPARVDDVQRDQPCAGLSAADLGAATAGEDDRVAVRVAPVRHAIRKARQQRHLDA